MRRDDSCDALTVRAQLAAGCHRRDRPSSETWEGGNAPSMPIKIAIALAGLVLLGGCGTQSTTNQASTQVTKAQHRADQAQQDLSPRAQRVLQDTQGLAADVARTTKSFAAGDITRQQAADRLDGYQQRADVLQRDARALPATESARSSLTGLAGQLQKTTAGVQAGLAGSDAIDPQSSLGDLRASAKQVYDKLQDRIPADAQQQLDRALSTLRR